MGQTITKMPFRRKSSSSTGPDDSHKLPKPIFQPTDNKVITVNGREFNANATDYLFPVDATEADRLTTVCLSLDNYVNLTMINNTLLSKAFMITKLCCLCLENYLSRGSPSRLSTLDVDQDIGVW